jgi:hypothetical protein
MKTPNAIKRLKIIVDTLISNADKCEEEITLKYCDIFTRGNTLSLEIKVELEAIDDITASNEEQTSTCFVKSVGVEEFDITDNQGDVVLSESQRKELVKWVNNYVYENIIR